MSVSKALVLKVQMVETTKSMDSDNLVFMTGKDTVKGKNIRRDPRVMLCIDDERPSFAFVLIVRPDGRPHVAPVWFVPYSGQCHRGRSPPDSNRTRPQSELCSTPTDLLPAWESSLRFSLHRRRGV
jgi:hypothetical protein